MLFIDFALNVPSISWEYLRWILDKAIPGANKKKTARKKLNRELPVELKGGRVVMSETDLSGSYPRKMHGRCDQVFERPMDNAWVLVDTKTRKYPLVFEKDIVQLSVYACILASKRNVKLASTAYVRIVTPDGKPTYKKVKLYPPETVAHIYDRRMAIKQGSACNIKRNTKLCRTCEFQSVCH